MSRVRYIGAEATTDAFGRDWPNGKWVDKHGLGEDALATLAQNPCFAVEERAAEPALASPAGK